MDNSGFVLETLQSDLRFEFMHPPIIGECLWQPRKRSNFGPR